MRTTSSVEGLNSVIQKDFDANTNIFKFTDSLRLFESEKSSDLHYLSLENKPKYEFQRRRREDQIRDEIIKENTELLKNGMISVLQFLKAVATKEVLPKNCEERVLKCIA